MSQVANGVQIPKNSSEEQERSSEIADLLAHENFFLNAGLVTAYSGEVLWRYAITQKGVEKCSIEIDQDEKNEGKEPKVTFRIKLDPKFKRLHEKMAELDGKPGIIAKWRKLRLMKKGVPLPGGLERTIRGLAEGYLPTRYKVYVQFTDK